MLESPWKLLQDEERAENIFVWWTCVVGVAAFLVALVAMALLK
jgi:hypothetical protein